MSGIGVNPYASFAAIGKASNTPTPAKPEAQKNPVADGVADFREAMQAAEKTVVDTAVTGADPHAMVEALANAELVLEAAVTVRDKVVEAYQELLRMPV